MLRDKGLQYHPDLVLVAYTMSSREHLDGDILATLLAAEQRQGGVSSARVNSWLVKSALYRFVRFRVLAARRPPPRPAAAAAGGTGTGGEAAAAAGDEGNGPGAGPQHYLDLVSADTVASYFGVLRQLAGQRRFQVLVAVFPRFVRTFSYYTFGRQHQFVAALAKENGFALVDLLVPFSDCRKASAEPISSDYFHPTPYGHRCAAAAIARAVLALPPRPPSP